MAVFEMGPVTSGVVNLVSTGEFASPKKPLFVRAKRFHKNTESKPIETAPLNDGEMDELNALRGLRNALHFES